MDGSEFNLFSSASFTEALALAYFPMQRVMLKTFTLGGRTWRIPCVGSDRTLTEFPFVDFFESEEATSEVAESISYLPHACHGVATSEEWQAQHMIERFDPAPYVDWTAFATWDSYAGLLGARNRKHASDSRRRRRKLGEELGTPTFTLRSSRPEDLDLCLRWKSEKCLAAGVHDPFENPAHRVFFHQMLDRGMLWVSTLAVDERVIAVHIGALRDGRFYSWIPGYDATLGTYAPGRLLFEDLLQCSYERGDRQFDFLIGDEPYKWEYATHTRLIAPLGHNPWHRTALRNAHLAAHRILDRAPVIRQTLRRLRHA